MAKFQEVWVFSQAWVHPPLGPPMVGWAEKAKACFLVSMGQTWLSIKSKGSFYVELA